ncbi:MAG: VapD family protein [Erysipelotrichaceae bacterium]
MTRKAINFDLNTKKLLEYYDKDNYNNAYRDIRKFMERNGFEHRQYSGYVSMKSVRFGIVENVLADAYQQFPWLVNCVDVLDVTSVGKNYDFAKKFKSQQISKDEKNKEKLNDLENEIEDDEPRLD